MVINNEELMQKFVRAGMIMRHIDGEGPCARGKHQGGHGHKHGEDFEKCCHDGKEMQGHGHGEEGGHEGKLCRHAGEGHGKGHGPGHGHRHGQARVLTMIAMQEGINQKDLAFLLGIRPQTIGEMLRKLEERGLVERKKSDEDARAIQVYLTEEGRARAAEIAERRSVVAADMFSALTEEEKEQLDSLLDKLGAEMDAHRPKCAGKRAESDEEEKSEE